MSCTSLHRSLKWHTTARPFRTSPGNAAHASITSSDASRVVLRLLPTDEDMTSATPAMVRTWRSVRREHGQATSGHYTGIIVKRLWLLRHAKSSWDDPSLPDTDRPLAPRGRRAVELLAAHLAVSEVRPSVVLCSSSLRTRETLAAILSALGDALEIRIERALYGAGAAELLRRLRQVSNRTTSVMLIGHNPGIQDLALGLASSGPALASLREKFPTGALATVDVEVERWRDVDNGIAMATNLVTPRSLEFGAEA
jgi:phosphohistidine phosphatase